MTRNRSAGVGASAFSGVDSALSTHGLLHETDFWRDASLSVESEVVR